MKKEFLKDIEDNSESKIFADNFISELDQQPQDGPSMKNLEEKIKLLEQDNKDLADRLTRVELNYQ